MKKPRKPKMSKYPKMPKASASLQTIKNYQHKCAAVDKANAHKASEYNRKISEISQAKKLHESLKAKRMRGHKQVHLKVA